MSPVSRDLLCLTFGGQYTLTLIPTEASFSSKDNCNKKYNYEKPADKPEQSFRWNLEAGETQALLCMDNGKEKNCFKKR